jgi:hypothetical protein
LDTHTQSRSRTPGNNLSSTRLPFSVCSRKFETPPRVTSVTIQYDPSQSLSSRYHHHALFLPLPSLRDVGRPRWRHFDATKNQHQRQQHRRQSGKRGCEANPINTGHRRVNSVGWWCPTRKCESDGNDVNLTQATLASA